MRQSIILSNEYEQLFLHEAEKTGLIETLPEYADIFNTRNDLGDTTSWFDLYLDGKTEQRKNLLRMILLFDEIILPQAPDGYNYQRLTDSGNFKIISFDDFYHDDPIHEEGHKEFALYLKPAILPLAEKTLLSYFKHIPKDIEYADFISDLYDAVLLRKKLHRKYNNLTRINKHYFDLKNADYYTMAESLNLPKNLKKEGRFFTDIAGLIVTMYEDLCWRLQVSSDNDASIMNCEYQLADIGCSDFSEGIDTSNDAYMLLRVECKKALGSLPEVSSIQEVIRLKNEKRHELHNLRQELSRIEYEIRNAGSNIAVEKAALDVSKASKALSKGMITSDITKWATVFFVPLGIASLFMQKPEITIGSGVLTIAGQASKVIGDYLSQKNNWLELLI